MIRPVVPDDSPELVAIAGSSGLFKSEELGAIEQMLAAYFAAREGGRGMLAFEEHGALVGLAYFAPREFADRVWELLMIAVTAPRQGSGVGSALLRAVEDAVREQDGRLLLIETSDKAGFDRTRDFYRARGYRDVAAIPDYFADGDGKVSFIKRLHAEIAAGAGR